MTAFHHHDIEAAIHRVAYRRLLNRHGNSDLDYEALTNLFRRAYCPWAAVRIMTALERRGHFPTREPQPERISMRRHKDRTMGAISHTINAAIDRAEQFA